MIKEVHFPFEPSVNVGGKTMFKQKIVTPYQAIIDLYFATLEGGNFKEISIPIASLTM